MKCGIEIHQRLDTHKLFCNCSSSLSGAKGIVIRRKQRVVAGELGEVDPAALYEYVRGRKIAYQAVEGCSCLVESDDEPPHELNGEALEIVIEMCLLLNAKVVDEIQMMRKTVIDGSNTSGFQRTAIAGMDGEMETSEGKVGITVICLEEESAGILQGEKGFNSFSLDRLGIPLIEIATDASIKSGEHAQEVAKKLGMLLRATGKVQRGIGTIRQDVNVSTERGARVEIKGAQELSLIGKMVDMEVKRQEGLVEVADELKARFGGKVKFEKKIVDASKIFEKTGCKFVARTIADGGKALAILLPKYGGLVGKELCENRRYGTELSDYAKALAGVGGIIHSGEKMEKYNIGQSEVAGVRKLLGAGEWDAFAIVADEEGKARKALDAVYARAMILEVPEETRRALPDGGSEFMRPLPGKARLYPETDVSPVRITKERIERIRSNLPKTFEERRGELEGKLSEDLREKILKSKYLQLFEKIVGELGVEPKIVAGTLEDAMKSLRRDGANVDAIGDEKIYEMFKLYSKNVFVKAAIPELMKEMANGIGAKEAVEKLGLKRMGAAELKKAIKEEKGDFGAMMRKYRLRVEAEDVKKLIS